MDWLLSGVILQNVMKLNLYSFHEMDLEMI